MVEAQQRRAAPDRSPNPGGRRVAQTETAATFVDRVVTLGGVDRPSRRIAPADAVLIALSAVSLGLASAFAPAVVAVVVGAAWLVAALVSHPAGLTRWVLVGVIAIPIGWNITSILRLQVPLMGATVPLTILVSGAASALAIALSLLAPPRRTLPLPRGARAVLGFAGVWLIAGLSLTLLGIRENGVLPAMRDAQYVLLWGWCVVVALAASARVSLSLRPVAEAAILGSTLYSAAVLVLFVLPDSVHSAVFASTYDMAQDTIRVGFGNGSVFLVVLPLMVGLVALRGFPVTRRWLIGAAGVLMISAVGVSQSRAVLLLVTVNCVLAWTLTGVPGVPSRRGRVVAYVLAAAGVLVLGIGVLSAVGVERFALVPGQLADRLTSLRNPETDGTLQQRVHTMSAAFDGWGSAPGTAVLGSGLGTEMDLYSPHGSYLGKQPLVDNVWAILAVKGGLAALLAFGAMLVVFGAVLLRAARRAPASANRALWRVLAASYPGFLVGTTLVTSHLFSSPAVILTLATLVTMAAFEGGGAGRGGGSRYCADAGRTVFAGEIRSVPRA